MTITKPNFSMKDQSPQIKYDGKFLRNGQITDLLREDVKKALNALEKAVRTSISIKNLRPQSFAVRDAYVVGSVLNGSTESDIDLYFRTEGTDVATNNVLKQFLFYVLCEGKDKSQWIDVYIGANLPSTGNSEGRPSYRITKQILEEIRRYNIDIGANDIKIGH